MDITSDPFILNAVTNIILNLILSHYIISTIRSYFSFSEKEQSIIDAEIEKFLLKEIIKPSVSEPGEILSPIFITAKKDNSSRDIFDLMNLCHIIISKWIF